MSDAVCAVAADTKLETPEGPLTIKSIASKPASILTRTDDGQVRFAMTKDAQKSGQAQPVLRLTLESGSSFRVGPEQVLLEKGMQEIRARDVRVGTELVSVFSFPEGYVYRTDDGEEVTSQGTISVVAVEPGGEAEVYAFRVNRTGRFALSAGVLGKAQGT